MAHGDVEHLVVFRFPGITVAIYPQPDGCVERLVLEGRDLLTGQERRAIRRQFGLCEDVEPSGYERDWRQIPASLRIPGLVRFDLRHHLRQP